MNDAPVLQMQELEQRVTEADQRADSAEKQVLKPRPATQHCHPYMGRSIPSEALHLSTNASPADQRETGHRSSFMSEPLIPKLPQLRNSLFGFLLTATLVFDG